MVTSIVVRTTFEGLHHYPGAPDEVAYLRQTHRHIFQVTVELEVFSDDRELEFIMVQHMVNEFLRAKVDPNDGVWHMGRLSCEQVAVQIGEYLRKEVSGPHDRYCKVSVFEDGENGAVVDFGAPYDMSLAGVDDTSDVKAQRLSFEQYQNDAYVAIQEHSNQQEEVMHWAIGLGEEAGEALSVIKHKYYGGQYSVEDMVGELGDVLWHVAALCTVLGIDMADVAEYNLAKLQFRYPTGHFDECRSQARHELAKDFSTDQRRIKLVSKIKQKMEENGYA